MSYLNKLKIKYFIPPLLISVYPVVFIYAENIGEIEFREILIPLLYLFLFGIYILGTSYFFVRDTKKASLIASLFLFIFYSFGHLYKGIESITKTGVSDTVFLFVVIPLLALAVFFIVRANKLSVNYITVLTVIVCALIVINLIDILRVSVFDASSYQTDHKDIKSRKNSGSEINDIPKRDIYYFVFDRYARENTLKSEFDFDNSEFLDYLEDKGFYVASDSNSNYPATQFSLASSLNMEYVNYLGEIDSEKNIDAALKALIENNKVASFLKSRGYNYYHFGAGGGHTRYNSNADYNINIVKSESTVRIIFITIYKETILWTILKLFELHEGMAEQLIDDERLVKRERILTQFEKLKGIVNTGEPKFVFVHMLIPHDPYVFDSEGNEISWDKEKNRSKKVNYIEQLRFLNKKIINAVDTILSGSATEPIIIIQSDEGPSPSGYNAQASFNKLLDSGIKQKFGILNAYFLPGIDYGSLYPSISPVNSFRLLFSNYFDADFTLLPDEHYFTNYNNRDTFIKVTDKLQ